MSASEFDGGLFDSVVGTVLGLVSVRTIKQVIVIVLSGLFFQGLFRKQVAGANIMFVVRSDN